jgi:hypothetical protein
VGMRPTAVYGAGTGSLPYSSGETVPPAGMVSSWFVDK